MTAPSDLHGLIERLRKALYYASPGKWEVDRERNDDGEYGGGPDPGRGYDDFLILDAEGRTLFGSENSTAKMIEEDYDEDGGSAWDQVAKRNATLIVEAVNALPILLDALERLSARTDTGGEMVLVPREPTAAMIRAYYETRVHGLKSGAEMTWSDMIAAAPATAEPKPMTGADVLRVFKPLPPEEAEVLRQFIGHADDDDPAPATADTGDVREVTQADRENAASVGSLFGRYVSVENARLRLGELDDDPLVQWFRRHRLAALRSTPQQGER